ncbi:MAG: histidine kinase dimerization/phosphoacceptor domain -containing protein [Bauldia sp.]
MGRGALLRELNHRVKNHLQMIINLLSLKASRQENETARKDFERAIGRIETIADLHGRLYRDDQVHIRAAPPETLMVG